MQKLYSLLIVLAITVSARSQTFQWAKKASSGVNGDAYGYNVALDAYGNSYVVGMYADVCVFDGGISVTSAGSKDIYIAKYTTNGNLLWVKSIGGTGEDSGTDIDVDAAGNVYITGHFTSTVDFDPGAAVYNLTSNAYTDIYIAKYDAEGNFQWAAKGGSQDYDYSNALAVDGAGNAYITGRFAYTLSLTGPGSSASATWGGGNYYDVFIAKCDANGNWLWAASGGGQGGDAGYGIAVDGTGYIYVTGQYTEYGGPAYFGSNALTGSGMFVTKYNNSGSSLWAVKAIGYETYGSDIDVDVNGNVYALGQFNTTVAFDNYPNSSSNASTVVNYVTPQTRNHCLVKYDASGNLQFAQTLGNVGSFWGNGISVNYSDEIFITGTFSGTTIVGGVQVTSSGFDNVFIAKFNPAGGLIWVTKAKGSYYHVAGGSGNEAGSVYVTGHFAYYASFGEFALTGACGQFCNFTMFITKLNDFLHTGAINASVCTGETISVPYTVTGTSLQPGNIFTAQLSDASGSFVNPVNIGTIGSTDASGTITATIPQSTAAGTAYRVRVNASTPQILGADNGTNITINISPVAEAGADQTILPGESVQIGSTAVAGNMYSWSPATGLNDASIANPVASPTITTHYVLTIADNKGCVDNDTVTVVIPSTIYINVSTWRDSVIHIVWGEEKMFNKYVIERSFDSTNYEAIDSITIIGNLTDINLLDSSAMSSVNLFNNILYSTEIGTGRFFYNEIQKSNLQNLSYRIRFDYGTNSAHSEKKLNFNPNIKPPLPVVTHCPTATEEPPLGMWALPDIEVQIYNCCKLTYQLYAITCVSSNIVCEEIGYFPKDCACNCYTDPCCIHNCVQYMQCVCGGSINLPPVPAGTSPWVGCNKNPDVSDDSKWVLIAIEDLSPSISITSTQSCLNPGNGTATANVTGGTPPYSFGWSDGQITPTATGLSTGVYSVTVTDANGCYDSEFTTINTLPSPTITVKSVNNTCPGHSDGSILIKVSEGTAPYTYLWNNGATTELITGLAAGIYTVTVTDVNGCTAESSITISTFPPPTITLTSTSPSPLTCEDNIYYFANVQPAGIYTYNWATSPSTSFTGQGTSSILVNSWSVSSAKVTVTITDANGCTATTEVLVNQCCLTKPTANTIILNNANASFYGMGFNGKILDINGTFKIDQNFVISNCLVYMGPNARIEVPGNLNNITLNVQCSHFTATCGTMWDGIYINNANNYLEMSAPGNCTVTSGQQAPIVEYAKNGVASVNGGRYAISGYTFRNNYIGIDVRPYAANHLGLVWNNTFKTQGTGLIAPMSGKAHIGMQVTDVQNLLIGFNQGNGFKNTFDNLHFGILSNNSSIYVINNDFKNIQHQTLICNLPGPCPPNPGIAIWAKGSPNIFINRTLTVGGPDFSYQNKFVSCGTGIKAEGLINCDIQKNIFTMDIAGGFNPGTGILIQGHALRYVNIKENNFTKYKTGIRTIKTSGSNISIDANKMANTGTNTNAAVGMRIENALPLTFFGGSTSITNNTPISGVQTGIFISGSDKPYIWLNKITLGQTTNSILNNNTVYYGIRIMGNTNTPTIDGNEIKRANNVVPGFNPPAAFNNGTTSKLIGISVESSNNAKVVNNNLAQMATGVRFFNNTITDADFLCNYMVNCQRGVTIEKCDIGDQGIFPGNPPGPIDDQWVYTGTFNREADIVGFNSPLNKYWYVRHLILPFGPGPQFSNYINPPGLIIPTLGDITAIFNCTNPCGTIFQCKQKKMSEIATNKPPYSAFTQEEQFLAKQSVFESLRNEPVLLQQGTPEDSILTAFHDSILQTNLGKVRKTHEYINISDYSLAQQENNSISTVDLMVGNHKKVNDIYLNTWGQERFDLNSIERAILTPIAIQNPIEGGKAVYTARVMVDTLLDDFSANGSLRLGNLDAEENEPIEYILLTENYFISKPYPNPNNGTIQIDYYIESNDIAKLEIIDISGRIVTQSLLVPANNKLIISKDFSDGLYFYRIISGDKVVLNDKIVIIK